VAYRQLCSVTFTVLGLVAFGCGGNTNSSAPSPSNPSSEQPPANTDQAPSSSDDQAPSGTATDEVPSNPDTPPASADAPAGTGSPLGALCQRFCAELSNVANNCTDGMGSIGMDDVCSPTDSCQVPPGVIPCEAEIVDLFDCALDNFQLLCSAEAQDPGGQDPAPAARTAPCQDVLRSFTTCAEAHDLTGDNTNTDPPGRDCTMGNACTQCLCTAGANMTAQQACFTGACTDTPPTP